MEEKVEKLTRGIQRLFLIKRLRIWALIIGFYSSYLVTKTRYFSVLISYVLYSASLLSLFLLITVAIGSAFGFAL